ncbi:MAG: hypothetical protein IJR27_05125 [Synergistaceae bacterium]|nr:hypothetical protein [Synergistaceae bacterium]
MTGIIILALFFLYFLLRNIMCPLFADDYSYAFIWDGKNGGNLINGIGRRERVKSLKDIFVSLYSHYFTWGGRMLAHFFVHLFVLIGKPLFNLVNSAVCILLLLVILKLGGSSPDDTYLVLWVISGFWFCSPFLMGTVLWLTGSCNYLWMSLVQCVFVLPYAQGISVNAFMISVLGFFAGLTNEAGGAGVFVLAVIFMIESWLGGNLMLWQVSGLIFFCAGYAVIMLSPGNMNQYRLIHGLPLQYKIPISETWNRKKFADNFRLGFLPVIAQELLLYVPIVIYFLEGGSFTDRTGIYILAFCLASLSGLSAMMFSPKFPVRAGFPSTVFLIPASVCAMQNISGSLSSWIVSIAVILMIADMAVCFYYDMDNQRQLRIRFKEIEEQKDNEFVVVSAFRPSKAALFTLGRTFNSYMIEAGDIEEYPYGRYGNRSIMFCQYYGLKMIMRESMPEK